MIFKKKLHSNNSESYIVGFMLCHKPESEMKLFSARMERALSSLSFEDLNIDTNCFNKHTRAAPFTPVSGRMVSMWISQVATTKHTEHNSAFLLLKPSAKASNTKPNSWLTKTNATLFSHSSADFSSSY